MLSLVLLVTLVGMSAALPRQRDAMWVEPLGPDGTVEPFNDLHGCSGSQSVVTWNRKNWGITDRVWCRMPGGKTPSGIIRIAGGITGNAARPSIVSVQCTYSAGEDDNEHFMELFCDGRRFAARTFAFNSVKAQALCAAKAASVRRRHGTSLRSTISRADGTPKAMLAPIVTMQC